MVAEPKRIFLSSPDVGVEEEQAAVEAVRSGWVAPLGPEVDSFEREIADFVGAGYGVALSSGTAALHLGLKALGVGPGDSVITSTMTFVATANAILYVGAEPIFVDSLDDGTLDPDIVDEVLVQSLAGGRRVRAIIPVDIYGRCADYSRILELSHRYQIPILADAAEALGATHQGLHAGILGDASALSFNGNKIMTTSGGGMLLTNSKRTAERVHHMASQSREPARHYEHTEIGYNYRLSNISAAIGRAQLRRLPEMIDRRRKIRKVYETFFAGVTGVTLLPGSPEEDNCWLTSILVSSAEAEWTNVELIEHLERANIESRPLWKPMHLQPLYQGAPYFGGKVAEGLFLSGVALPSGSVLSDADVNRVLDAINNFLVGREV